MHNKSKPKLYYIIGDIILLILIALTFIIMLINHFDIWQPITVAAIFLFILWETIYYIKSYKNIVYNPNNIPYIIFNFILIGILSYAELMYIKKGLVVPSILYIIAIIYLFRLNFIRIKLYKVNREKTLEK